MVKHGEMRIIKCAFCGKDAMKASARAIYCSKRCKHKAEHLMSDYLKNCPDCGDTFRTKRRARTYCYPCANKRRIYVRAPRIDVLMEAFTAKFVDYSQHNLKFK